MMADKVSIAIRREQAMTRLANAMDAFALKQGVQPVDMPTQGRDADLLSAQQFEALAGWMESALDAQQTPSAPTTQVESDSADVQVSTASDYDAMTKAELVFEAQRRKIDVSGMKTKAEVIDALLASDGISEDQQAAMDESKG